MLSTPAPIPMSIWPSEIMRAMWLTATRPDEHWRFTVATEEVVGKPAVTAREVASDSLGRSGRTFYTIWILKASKRRIDDSPASWAMRATVAPPPGGRTLPTWISSTSCLSTPPRLTTSSKTVLRRSSGHVSFSPPFLARVMGVRHAATMTTSFGFWARRAALPPPALVLLSWETRPERRSLAEEAKLRCERVRASLGQPRVGPRTRLRWGALLGGAGARGGGGWKRRASPAERVLARDTHDMAAVCACCVRKRRRTARNAAERATLSTFGDSKKPRASRTARLRLARTQMPDSDLQVTCQPTPSRRLGFPPHVGLA